MQFEHAQSSDYFPSEDIVNVMIHFVYDKLNRKDRSLWVSILEPTVSVEKPIKI